MGNKLRLELVVDDKGNVVVKQFGKEAEEAFDKMERGVGRTDSAVTRLKTNWFALAAGLSGIIFSTKKLINAASDLEEVESKFNVVYADQIKLAEQRADILIQGYAMSTKEAKEYLASVQDLLVPMGMARNLAGQLSGEIVKLAADLGSFNNLPTVQVIADMQSALVGNYETMKKYGVVLNMTTVQEQALAMGLARTKDELTAAHKAQAAYTIMVEGSAAAVGDMDRTSDGYANTMKRFKAATEDLAASLGQSLLPALTVTFDMLGKMVSKYNEWIKGPGLVDRLKADREELEKQATILKTTLERGWELSEDHEDIYMLSKRQTAEYREQLQILLRRIELIGQSIKEEERLLETREKAGETGTPGAGRDVRAEQERADYLRRLQQEEQAEMVAMRRENMRELGAIMGDQIRQEMELEQERRDFLQNLRQEEQAEMVATRSENMRQLGAMIKEQADREVETERQKNALKQQTAMNWFNFSVSIANSLYALSNQQSRALFWLTKVAAVATATVSALQAYGMALAYPPGPPSTIPMAKAVLALGLANAAAIGAVAIGQGAGGAGGGGGVGAAPVATYTASPYTGVPATGTAEQAGPSLEIHINGPITGEESLAWLVDRLNDWVENKGGRLVATRTAG